MVHIQLHQQNQLMDILNLHLDYSEKWLPLNNHVDYEISSTGKVRNSLTKFILSQSLFKDNYTVFINKKSYQLAKLLAETFLTKVDGLEKLVFKNSDSTDVRLCNLEWQKKQYKNIIEKDDKFIVSIIFEKEKLLVGKFNSLEEAIENYNQRAIELYSDNAYLLS